MRDLDFAVQERGDAAFGFFLNAEDHFVRILGLHFLVAHDFFKRDEIIDGELANAIGTKADGRLAVRFLAQRIVLRFRRDDELAQEVEQGRQRLGRFHHHGVGVRRLGGGDVAHVVLLARLRIVLGAVDGMQNVSRGHFLAVAALHAFFQIEHPGVGIFHLPFIDDARREIAERIIAVEHAAVALAEHGVHKRDAVGVGIMRGDGLGDADGDARFGLRDGVSDCGGQCGACERSCKGAGLQRAFCRAVRQFIRQQI